MHHVEEEEGRDVQKARRVLSDEELESLGARMERAKQNEEKAA